MPSHRQPSDAQPSTTAATGYQPVAASGTEPSSDPDAATVMVPGDGPAVKLNPDRYRSLADALAFAVLVMALAVALSGMPCEFIEDAAQASCAYLMGAPARRRR
jgi:hypothetical protein